MKKIQNVILLSLVIFVSLFGFILQVSAVEPSTPLRTSTAILCSNADEILIEAGYTSADNPGYINADDGDGSQRDLSTIFCAVPLNFQFVANICKMSGTVSENGVEYAANESATCLTYDKTKISMERFQP